MTKIADTDIPNVQPAADKLLIWLEPEQTHFSTAPSLVRTDAVKQDHVFRVGRLCRVGPGQWNKKQTARKPIGIEVGARVLFIKFVATHTKTAESIQAIVGKEFAIIDVDDALLELAEDVDINSISQ